MKLYYFIGRILRPFMVIALYLYSYIFRTPRARLVLKNEYGEILFVQSWLSTNDWGLPGGGIAKDESPAHAAARELREEVGIAVDESSLRRLVELRSRGHKEIVFEAQVDNVTLPAELPNKFEIKDAAWISPRHLPQMEPLAHKIIAQLEK